LTIDNKADLANR